MSLLQAARAGLSVTVEKVVAGVAAMVVGVAPPATIKLSTTPICVGFKLTISSPPQA